MNPSGTRDNTILAMATTYSMATRSTESSPLAVGVSKNRSLPQEGPVIDINLQSLNKEGYHVQPGPINTSSSAPNMTYPGDILHEAFLQSGLEFELGMDIQNSAVLTNQTVTSQNTSTPKASHPLVATTSCPPVTECADLCASLTGDSFSNLMDQMLACDGDLSSHNLSLGALDFSTTKDCKAPPTTVSVSSAQSGKTEMGHQAKRCSNRKRRGRPPAKKSKETVVVPNDTNSLLGVSPIKRILPKSHGAVKGQGQEGPGREIQMTPSDEAGVPGSKKRKVNAALESAENNIPVHKDDQIVKKVSFCQPIMFGHPQECVCISNEDENGVPIEQLWSNQGQLYFLTQVRVLVIGNHEVVGFENFTNKKHYLSLGELICTFFPKKRQHVMLAYDFLPEHGKTTLTKQEFGYLRQHKCVDSRTHTREALYLPAFRQFCRTLKKMIPLEMTVLNQFVDTGNVYTKVLGLQRHCPTCGGCVKSEACAGIYLSLVYDDDDDDDEDDDDDDVSCEENVNETVGQEIGLSSGSSQRNETRPLPGLSQGQDARLLPGSSQGQDTRSISGLSWGQDTRPLPGLSQRQDTRPLPGFTQGQVTGPFHVPGLSQGQVTRPLPGLSQEQDTRPLPGLSQGQDTRSISGLSWGQDTRPLPGLSQRQGTRPLPGFTQGQVTGPLHVTGLSQRKDTRPLPGLSQGQDTRPLLRSSQDNVTSQTKNHSQAQVGRVLWNNLVWHCYKMTSDFDYFISLKEIVQTGLFELGSFQNMLLNIQYRPQKAPPELTAYFQTCDLGQSLWIDLCTVRMLCHGCQERSPMQEAFVSRNFSVVMDTEINVVDIESKPPDPPHIVDAPTLVTFSPPKYNNAQLHGLTKGGNCVQTCGEISQKACENQVVSNAQDGTKNKLRTFLQQPGGNNRTVVSASSSSQASSKTRQRRHQPPNTHNKGRQLQLKKLRHIRKTSNTNIETATKTQNCNGSPEMDVDEPIEPIPQHASSNDSGLDSILSEEAVWDSRHKTECSPDLNNCVEAMTEDGLPLFVDNSTNQMNNDYTKSSEIQSYTNSSEIHIHNLPPDCYDNSGLVTIVVFNDDCSKGTNISCDAEAVCHSDFPLALDKDQAVLTSKSGDQVSREGERGFPMAESPKEGESIKLTDSREETLAELSDSDTTRGLAGTDTTFTGAGTTFTGTGTTFTGTDTAFTRTDTTFTRTDTAFTGTGTTFTGTDKAFTRTDTTFTETDTAFTGTGTTFTGTGTTFTGTDTTFTRTDTAFTGTDTAFTGTDTTFTGTDTAFTRTDTTLTGTDTAFTGTNTAPVLDQGPSVSPSRGPGSVGSNDSRVGSEHDTSMDHGTETELAQTNVEHEKNKTSPTQTELENHVHWREDECVQKQTDSAPISVGQEKASSQGNQEELSCSYDNGNDGKSSTSCGPGPRWVETVVGFKGKSPTSCGPGPRWVETVVGSKEALGKILRERLIAGFYDLSHEEEEIVPNSIREDLAVAKKQEDNRAVLLNLFKILQCKEYAKITKASS